MDSPIKTKKKHAMTLSPWQISEVVSTAGPPKAASLRVKRQAATELPRAWQVPSSGCHQTMGKSENPSENPSGNPLKMLMLMILWDFPHDFPMDLNSFWPHVIQPHGSTEHWQAWPHPGGEIWRLKIKWDTAKIDLKGTILMRSLMIKHGIWGFQILRQPRKTATRKSSNSVPCAVLSLQLF